MVTELSRRFATQIGQIVTWLRGYEETGVIAIDLVSYDARNAMQEAGVL